MKPMPPMYASTFIFSTRQFDAAFHRLDAIIATAARSIDGYLGEETWTDTDKGLVSNVYYWQSLEALQALMQHPAHLEAKAAQARWLDGYQVVISQVLRTYGDQGLAGRLSTAGLFAQSAPGHFTGAV